MAPGIENPEVAFPLSEPALSRPAPEAAFSGPWPAPGKINLFLHVLGRRADGLHRLQTLFQLLDLGDELYFQGTADGLLRLEPYPGAPPPEANLVLRAAALLRSATGEQRGARIRLRKRLPVGGGLGGGSSNAATTLVALNRLWGLHLGVDRLAALGLCLGADVPLFVRGRSAWAEGVGERLTALDLPTRRYVLIDPRCQVSTSAVYQAPDLTRTTPPLKMTRFKINHLKEHMGHNDCLPVTCRLYPEVGRALRWLGGFAPAYMSGTGGGVFAAVEGSEQAEAILARLPKPWRAWCCLGVNQSSLHAMERGRLRGATGYSSGV